MGDIILKCHIYIIIHLISTKLKKQIVSLVNKKGRGAKTTTAFVLARELSKRQFHVLVNDWDAQTKLTRNSGSEDDAVALLIFS